MVFGTARNWLFELEKCYERLTDEERNEHLALVEIVYGGQVDKDHWRVGNGTRKRIKRLTDKHLPTVRNVPRISGHDDCGMIEEVEQET